MSRAQREAVELAWHGAICCLAVAPVARRVGRSRPLSALATATLVAGCLWHCEARLRAAERRRWIEAR